MIKVRENVGVLREIVNEPVGGEIFDYLRVLMKLSKLVFEIRIEFSQSQTHEY